MEDVKEIGKAVRVKYKGDSNNSFSLLTRAGRREWRAAGRGDVENGSLGGMGEMSRVVNW